MLRILLAEQSFVGRYLPVDTERGIENADAAVCLWMVKLIALILEHSRFTQHSKTMSKAFRDEELQADG